MSIRLKLVGVLCVLVLAFLLSAPHAEAAKALFAWCYNGTCCAMDGEAVTNNCDFGCPPSAQGRIFAAFVDEICTVQPTGNNVVRTGTTFARSPRNK